MKIIILIITSLTLIGCMVSPLKELDPKPSLGWCPPLPNCASTEAISFIHSVPPFKLKKPLAEAWPIIRKTVIEIPRTSIESEFNGYIYAKSYSAVFGFLDYFEVLVNEEDNTLNVRSSSLLGITDFFVNDHRVEKFREQLKQQGVIH